MGRSALAGHAEKRSLGLQTDPVCLEGDPRWQVAQRAVAGRHFVRSPLLSKFLLYIVAETIEGRAHEITEHQIGVQVFDRPSSYRTVEDNIVRNYARQLRRRLSEYFSDDGASEPLHIDIPLGGYVPVFVSSAADCSATDCPENSASKPVVPIRVRAAELAAGAGLLSAGTADRPLTRGLLLAAYTAIVFCAAWFAALTLHPGRSHDDPVVTRPLWNAMFQGPLSTYIVPADAGFNLLEDLSHHPITLADYLAGDYSTLSLPQVDSHSAEDLRGQHFTSFADLQIVSSLSRLPEFNSQRAILRFPRDLRLDDLKDANAVIIGSVGSNPWAAVAENNANFRIVYRAGMEGAAIVNTRPQPGEAATYVSHWNKPAHETFALISCLPNLEGNGRLLVMQGLDVAGTQAAGEALFHPAAIAPILRRATRPDGSLRFFEILLRSTSIESSATGTQVIGSRIY
jgi:hypothetical protein